MDKFNPHVATKLHTLLARWKILMLQTLHVMVKKKGTTFETRPTICVPLEKH
jgi:hypothetical protein